MNIRLGEPAVQQPWTTRPRRPGLAAAFVFCCPSLGEGTPGKCGTHRDVLVRADGIPGVWCLTRCRRLKRERARFIGALQVARPGLDLGSQVALVPRSPQRP